MRSSLTVAGCALAISALSITSRARAEDDAPPPLEPGENALETYELNALQLIHVGNRDEEGTWRPARGKYRRAMSYEDFYRTVERPDLAEEQAGRAALSNLFFYGGWATMLAGGVLFFVGFEDGEPQTISWIGVGVAAGGVGLVLYGGSLGGTKLSEREAEALSAEHNARLRQRLGVAPEPSAGRRVRPRFRLSLAPRLTKSATGLELVGMF